VVSLKEKGYASATRDQRIAKAKTFFKWGFDNGFLESDPSVALKRPKNDWQPDPFSPDELHFLLDQSKRGSMGVRDHSIVCTLLDTGLRAVELVRLKPEDVSIKTGQVKVYHGKGGKSRTTIMGKRSKEALWRWMTICPESPYLYCTSTGRRMLESHLYLTIKRIGDKVSIRAYPHRFRHTFATQYLKLGGDPYSLQYLLGHEDMTITKMYVKLAAQDVKDLYRSPLDAL
jgi:site-specific recombinase XerD